MLKNDYLVVKIGIDSAENEPSKVVWSSVVWSALEKTRRLRSYALEPDARLDEIAALKSPSLLCEDLPT